MAEADSGRLSTRQRRARGPHRELASTAVNHVVGSQLLYENERVRLRDVDSRQ
jgi:hypothetical protein